MLWIMMTKNRQLHKMTLITSFSSKFITSPYISNEAHHQSHDFLCAYSFLWRSYQQRNVIQCIIELHILFSCVQNHCLAHQYKDQLAPSARLSTTEQSPDTVTAIHFNSLWVLSRLASDSLSGCVLGKQSSSAQGMLKPRGSWRNFTGVLDFFSQRT